MEPIKLTVKTANEVYAALQNIDVYNHVIKKEDGMEEVVKLPYKISGKGRWNLTKCLNKLRETNDAFNTTRDGLIKEVSAGKATIDGTDADRLAEFNTKMEEVLAQEIDTKGLLRIRVADLNLEVNPIPVAVLSLLSPILDDSE